jgi:exonuclease SbcC
VKLLRIEVENLNSLYGRHLVDFDADLGGAPLVLITGPTGAGKSTVLDAVGLALFGRTPRLVAPRSDDAALDARSALSRGAGEGSAAVEFRKREGGRSVRYRATWYCKRARKRPDGALQDPVRTLERFDPATGAFVALASDARAARYQPHFDRVLEGLTVTDFQRSVLLAQGEFSAFLKADADERVNLLERLTATERFREIGERAAQARAHAQQAVEALEQELEGVALLSEADRAAQVSEVERLKEEVRRSRGEARRVEAGLDWLEERAQHRRRREEQALRALEASEALRLREHDLARVAEHERCAAAGQTLRALEGAGQELDRTAGEVAHLQAEERTKASALAEAQAASALASAARERVALEGAQAEPELARAREVRTLFASARAELEAVSAERLKALADSSSLEAALRGAEERRASLEERRARAEGAVAALASARPLLEKLAGFEARFKALRARSQELEGKRERREEKAALAAEAARRLESALELVARARGEASRNDTALEEATLVLTHALGGAFDAPTRREALRRDLQAATARERALEALLETEAQRSEREGVLADLDGRLGAVERELASAAVDRPRLEGARSEREQELRAVAQELDDLSFLVGIARERRRIREGERCPLCGSERHPYLEDARLAQVDERTRQRSEALKGKQVALLEALQGAQGELEALSRREAGLRATRGSLAPERELRRRELAACVARFASGFEALRLAQGAPLAQEKRSATESRAGLESAARALDEAESRRSAAQAVRQRAADRLADGEREHQAAGIELAARERALAEAGEELLRLNRQVQADLESLALELGAQGAPPSGSALDGLAKSMRVARERARSTRAADEQLVEAKEAHAHADRAAAEARVRARGLAERLAALEASERARAADAEALRARAAMCLSGEDPDKVEVRLKGRLEVASRGLADAETARGVLEAAGAAARGKLEIQARRLAEASRAKDELAQALGRALSDLGLERAQALRERVLSPEEQERLKSLREALERAAASAAALLQSRERDLEEVDVRRPAELPPEADAAALRATRAALEPRLEAQESQLHAGLARLLEDDARRAVHAQRAGRLDELRRERETWEQLHALIGVRDGQQFQRFAQILNLEELIRKANTRLARISPRFQLAPARDARGESQLAFAVRDEWHGGVERPITTLSGGESFLVSLALALALADYRAVRMPIETLLLDEGFGTLDRDTLGMAMSALQALTSEGVQIAIISHVEWLRDQIEAQVAVEPRGNGRSRVVVSVAGKILAGVGTTAAA